MFSALLLIFLSVLLAGFCWAFGCLAIFKNFVRKQQKSQIKERSKRKEKTRQREVGAVASAIVVVAAVAALAA